MSENKRDFASITDAEKKVVEGWFPSLIVGKFVRLYFQDQSVMLDYTVGGGPFVLNVGDSPQHLFLLHDMGFNVFRGGRDDVYIQAATGKTEG